MKATQSIFARRKESFCFNYLNKKVNDGEFKEFQEIVMSFRIHSLQKIILE